MKPFANHCLDRMGYGPRTGSVQDDIAAFEQMGSSDDERLQAWLDAQINWQSINDSDLDARVDSGGFVTLNKSLPQMWADYHVAGTDRYRPAKEMEHLVVGRGIFSNRQLLEVLADFWHNHFNVYSRSFYAGSSFTSWDRDVIRPPVSGFPRPAGFENGHLFGNFRQLLELTSRHAAMQYYLDNYINEQGSPNENYAREIMELHTLGAENYVSLGDPNLVPRIDVNLPWGAGGADIPVSLAEKYVDDDVYAAMRMLTGWKIKDRDSSASSNFEDTGEFFFYEDWHDKFEKTILGKHWGNFEPAPQDIAQFFDILAYHPGTAAHIAGKLCRRFISENPPQAAIDLVRDAFIANRYAPNQLELTYRALFNSSYFKDPAVYGTLFKPPLHAFISAMRVTDATFLPSSNFSHEGTIMYLLRRAGQHPFYWRPPDGYPMHGAYWQGSMSLVNTMRAYDWVIDRDAGTANTLVPVLETTLNASTVDLPSHTPNNIAAFWMKKILGYEPPGGWLGDPLHTTFRDFMRLDPYDPTQWPADVPIPDISSNNSPHYWHERLRALVKLMLSSREFLSR